MTKDDDRVLIVSEILKSRNVFDDRPFVLFGRATAYREG
jgi:hypothetical protein